MVIVPTRTLPGPLVKRGPSMIETATTASAREADAARRLNGKKSNRESRLRVRVLPEEIRRWRAAAAAQGGRSLSGWLRAVADQTAACDGDPLAWRRDLATFARDLNAGIGNNLDRLIAVTSGTRGLTIETGERLADAVAVIADELALLSAAVQAHLLRNGSPKRRGGCRSPRRAHSKAGSAGGTS